MDLYNAVGIEWSVPWHQYKTYNPDQLHLIALIISNELTLMGIKQKARVRVQIIINEFMYFLKLESK